MNSGGGKGGLEDRPYPSEFCVHISSANKPELPD